MSFEKMQPPESCKLLFDEPLSKHTYYRVGGRAAFFAEPKSIADLECLASEIARQGCPVFLLGAGSNLLVSDEGFAGFVIKTLKISKEISVRNESGAPGGLVVRTGASVAVSSLLRKAAEAGWAGLEFLAGIPGSVGGVVSMNAGTHLGEAKDALWRVEVFQLLGAHAQMAGLKTFEQKDFRFEYRKNLFIPEGALIVAAEWAVRKGDPARIRHRLDEILTRRKQTQPLDAPSCGSVFKNPAGTVLKAWQVIEKLGLRGHRIGHAQFSEKHCNFILNLGGASAKDIYSLIQLAKGRAKKELGIELVEEVKCVGEFAL